jgi:hypothetical protein
MTRMPVSSLSWRPIPLGAVLRPSRPSYSLGQIQTRPLQVEVVDVSGNPVRDAGVDVSGTGIESITASTDEKGLASFDVKAGNYDIRAIKNGLVIMKKITREEMLNDVTAFLQFPICIQGPLFRPIDLLIFGAAGGMIAAGTYWKIKPLEMTGEIALGAAIFGFIYRLQCL